MEINIQDVTNEYLKKLEDSGEIKKLIEENIKKTITNAVEDAFGGWDVRKKLEKAIADEFIKGFEDVGLTAYNQFIADQIKLVTTTYLKNDLAEKVNETLSKLLLMKKETIKFSEIVNAYVEHVQGKFDPYDDRDQIEEYENLISINIDEDDRYGWNEVTFCLGEIKESYYSKEFEKEESVKMTLSTCDNEEEVDGYKKAYILGLYYEDRRIENLLIKGYMSDFEALLINLALNNTKVILDMDETDESYHINEDYED